MKGRLHKLYESWSFIYQSLSLSHFFIFSCLSVDVVSCSFISSPCDKDISPDIPSHQGYFMSGMTFDWCFVHAVTSHCYFPFWFCCCLLVAVHRLSFLIVVLACLIDLWVCSFIHVHWTAHDMFMKSEGSCCCLWQHVSVQVCVCVCLSVTDLHLKAWCPLLPVQRCPSQWAGEHLWHWWAQVWTELGFLERSAGIHEVYVRRKSNQSVWSGFKYSSSKKQQQSTLQIHPQTWNEKQGTDSVTQSKMI